MDLLDYLMDKTADVTGTHAMPQGVPVYSDRNPNPTKTIKKVGEALEQEDGVGGEQVQRLPQAQPVRLRVDVTAKEAPTVATAKEAQHYALPSLARYPLDSYGHVKQAAAYFDDQYKLMAPQHRREYCENLVKRASALGIEVSARIQKYGGAGYASAGELEAALAMREGVIKESQFSDGLDKLRELRPLMEPGDFAVALGEFDKVAGIADLYGSDIYDPYFSTFGKVAEDESAILAGNDYISTDELRRFARTCSGKLCDVFGKDVVEEFRKDPVGITRSMPVEQKKMIIRLATSTLTDPTST